MTDTLVLVLLSALAAGAVSAGAIVWLARQRLRLALLLSPLVALLPVGTGLVVGVNRMLISGSLTSILAILAVAVPVAVGAGILVAHDVRSRLEHSEAALADERARRALESSRRELITWMSHDLRTPIAGIRAMAEALADGVAPDPGRYHRDILAAAERTTAMVGDLMSLADLEGGTADLAAEPVDVSDLASDLVGQLQPLAARRGIRLQGGAAGDTEVIGDTTMLARAIGNLVVNAIEYSHPGGDVTLTVSRRDDEVNVEVLDSCGGISEEVAARMTEPGWRGDQARTPAEGSGGTGSGLGLAITNRIAEGHGGRLRVAPEEGRCRAHLALPAARR